MSLILNSDKNFRCLFQVEPLPSGNSVRWRKQIYLRDGNNKKAFFLPGHGAIKSSFFILS